MTEYHLDAEFAKILGGFDFDAQRNAAAIDAVEAELDGNMERAEQIRAEAALERMIARAL